jgi:hypothetical protein
MELVECEVFGVQQTHLEVDLGIGAEPQPRRDVLRLVSCRDIGTLKLMTISLQVTRSSKVFR